MSIMGISNINQEYKINDSTDLEDLQLPPLDGSTSFDDYVNCVYSDDLCSSQSSLKNNDFSYTKELSSDAENVEHIEINDMNDDERCDKISICKSEDNFSLTTKKCCFCYRKSILRNMFIFENNKHYKKNNVICLKCSSNLSISRLLKDWEKEPNTAKTIICKRCNKEKSYYRFKGNNKYCDYCLLKKKWSRLRTKNECENINDDSVCQDTKYAISKVKQNVICCFCKESVIISQCFKFYENTNDNYSDKMICLYCSLNIKDWRCLRDWEDSIYIIDGRLCSRCKKIKSLDRFKKENSGCEYCSLKRKRIYLLNKH